MRELLLPLTKKSILTDDNILSMKRYILGLHPSYSSLQRADILANAVHRHIDHNLPDIGKFLKQQVRTKLLHSAYNNHVFTIMADDVFQICMELITDKAEALQPVQNWLKQHGVNVTIQQIQQLIGYEEMKETIQTTLVPSVQELMQAEPQNTAAMQQPFQKSWKSEVTSFKQTVKQTVLKRTHGVERVEFLNEILSRHITTILLCLVVYASFPISIKIPTQQTWISYSTPLVAIEEVTPIIEVELVSISVVHETTPTPKASQASQVSQVAKPTEAPFKGKSTVVVNELPSNYKYTEINIDYIRKWLQSKNSILAQEPYLSVIFETALAHDIHPLLLIAITGQEQSFVPNNHPSAWKVANNPFNVYGSWMAYNTNIADSSRIAAVTILNLVKGYPDGMNPIAWINRKYAEDTNWHIGVEKYFKQLSNAANDS